MERKRKSNLATDKDDEPENLVIVIEEDTQTDDQTLKTSPKVLNDHIIIKHNLPAFVPLRRERYNFLPTYKLKDIHVQTDDIRIVTEDEYSILKIIKSHRINLDMLQNNNYKINIQLMSINDKSEDLGKTTDDLENQGLLKKVVKQSAENKALLNKFYGSINKVPGLNEMHSAKYKKIVNASNIINNILVKDADKVENQSTFGPPSTCKNLIDKPSLTMNINSEILEKPICFSPVSDVSNCSSVTEIYETESIGTPSSPQNNFATMQSQPNQSYPQVGQCHQTQEPQNQTTSVLPPPAVNKNLRFQFCVGNNIINNFQMPINQSPVNVPPGNCNNQMLSNKLQQYLADQHSYPSAPLRHQGLMVDKQPYQNSAKPAQSPCAGKPWQMQLNTDPSLAGIVGAMRHQGLMVDKQPYQNSAKPAQSPCAGKPWQMQLNTDPSLAGIVGAMRHQGLMVDKQPYQNLAKPAQSPCTGKPWEMQLNTDPSLAGNVGANFNRQSLFSQTPGAGTLPSSTITSQNLQENCQQRKARSSRGRGRGRRKTTPRYPGNDCPISPSQHHQNVVPQVGSFNKYQMLMEQQKRNEMERIQRAWESQIKNYPNSSWSQKYRQGGSED